MNVRARLAKLELIQGGRVPTDHEFQDAVSLLRRHFEAIGAPEYFGFEPDPHEVVLMKAAEAAGEIMAARDVERRWRRAHGYRETTMAEIGVINARLREVFADMPDDEASNGVDDEARPQGAE